MRTVTGRVVRCEWYRDLHGQDRCIIWLELDWESYLCGSRVVELRTEHGTHPTFERMPLWRQSPEQMARALLRWRRIELEIDYVPACARGRKDFQSHHRFARFDTMRSKQVVQPVKKSAHTGNERATSGRR